MTNQKHLAILKQGVKVWNQWRQEHADIEVDLSEADLNRANLNNLRYANLRSANLSSADLNGIHFYHADLSGAILSGVDLSGADLWGANLFRAILSDADLFGAVLTEANLSRAILSGANLSFADLFHANLTKADLRDTNLRGADIRNADLSQADFSRALVGWTRLNSVDLRTVKGLETLEHIGPSSIGINTLYRSQGQIPESFLRQAGVPEDLLASLPSMINHTFEYPSCFISYSSHDENFAEQLYTHLQANGVHCWFAPKDLKIGDKFWHRIDESIRLSDKLLVVLSENSIESEWVEREVVAALEKEQQQGKSVLFPITLDETFKQATAPWAADLRRQRHIGDFTRWKNHDAYEKVFTRLLRDLKAETKKAEEW